ncbi:MAG: Hint domain-containing protein [Paracoccaceae bacterium]|uniref:Hint domain-containing protein n=1 Tax=Seohaeicola saemankumensis TaxID=481181 RepID=UPI001E4B838B|nr:Hint domain-containing protein [Seohaeicola saemankumensis]MCD1624483.1 Hint domain-containing protein [Seohaeicola saemankumensis]
MGAPNIVGTTTGSVTEKTVSTATGTLTDNGNGFADTWSISAAPTYGSATINGSGQWTYVLDDSNPAVDALDAGETMTDTFVVRLTSNGDDFQTITITITGVPCFALGTRIDTPDGPKPVEDLRAGDMVMTLDAGVQPVIWTGSRTVCGRGEDAPVLIKAGALGNRADLFVSPQHRMLMSAPLTELHSGEPELLVPAIHLINETTILRAPCDEVTYFHILLAQHHILFSEGAPSESFFAGGEWASAIPEVAAWSRDLQSRNPARWARATLSARPQGRRFEGRVLSELIAS